MITKVDISRVYNKSSMTWNFVETGKLFNELLKERDEAFAIVEQLKDGFKIIHNENTCCPKGSHHGNKCPRWIAEEALELAAEAQKIMAGRREEK
jgi:hypothetical protein